MTYTWLRPSNETDIVVSAKGNLIAAKGQVFFFRHRTLTRPSNDFSDENIQQVAFSPDETKVACATLKDGVRAVAIYKVMV